MSGGFVHVRAYWRLMRVAVCLLFGVLWVALAFPRLREGARARIKQRWSAALLNALGVRLHPETGQGLVLPHGLVVANHISFLDIYVINALLPASFVAKSDVARWPVIGWLTARTDNLFIARGHRGAAHHIQQNMSAILSAGRRLVVFPEGTTSNGNSVLPFHSALLQSAVASGVPVICLALGYQNGDGHMTALPAYVGDDTLWQCIWRIVTSDTIVVRVSPVAQLSGTDTDRRHLAHHAHQSIAAAVAGWHVAGKPDGC
jgi:1-acyl-sn-glycerol-3-phosphate acyltransferase